MKDFYKKIGLNIRKARKEIGLSQNELAEVLNMSRPSISNIELGVHKVQLDTLIDLSEILRVPFIALIGMENVRLPDDTIYLRIIQRFGPLVQIDKIQEEAQELALALHQYKCPTKDKIKGLQKIYGELADMKIMMKQAEFLFDANRIDAMVSEKLKKCETKYL